MHNTRVFPQAVDLERGVLGAILQTPKAYAEMDCILVSDDFYHGPNALIFQAVEHLHLHSRPIDLLTVTETMKKLGTLDEVGGPFYLSELMTGIGGSSHLDFHARVVKDKSLARRIIELTGHIQALAFDETQDIADVIEQLEKELTDLTVMNTGHDSQPIYKVLQEATDEVAQIQYEFEQGITTAISTGLSSLDDALNGGLKPSQLIVLGGRTSMGKTQHALSMSKAAAMQGKNVLFASLEMPATQLVMRLLVEDGRVNQYHYETGRMSLAEWEAMEKIKGELWDLGLRFADKPSINYLPNIKSEARRLWRKGLLDLLVVDHLGLVQTNIRFERRQQELHYITMELKNLAKELKIPIVILAQLKRPPKGETIPKPTLEDLRESGDIEQNADTVILIHKPDYYNPEAEDSNGVKWSGRGILKIGKQRNGKRNNTVIFYHDPHYKQILDHPYQE